MKPFFLLIASFLAFAHSRAEQPVKLQFSPHVPVEQTNELTIELHQSLPGVKLDASSHEVFKAVVKITGDETGAPIVSPPLDVSYTLKDMKIDLNINDKAVRYHTSEPAQSVEVAQLAKLIDKPIPLHFGEGFALSKENPELSKLISDLPVLEEIDFGEVLKELFIYVFSLAGKELKVGSNFHVDFPTDLTAGIPIQVNYEVVKIDDQVVQANMTANIDAKNMKLDQKLELENGKPEEVSMSLTGKITGLATWNRKEALIHQTESTFKLIGSLKIAELEWPISVNGSINIKSVPVK